MKIIRGVKENGDGLIFSATQDIAPILEFNKECQKDTSLTRTKEMRHVARIPDVIIEHWLNTEGFNFYRASPAEIKAKLNDINNKFLRTDLSRL